MLFPNLQHGLRSADMSQYTDNQGGGPINSPGNGLQGYNIICGNDSAPAKISAPIAAGQTVRVRWSSTGINSSVTPGDDAWPGSHKGPVIDYIAACNGPCSAVSTPEYKQFAIRLLTP